MIALVDLQTVKDWVNIDRTNNDSDSKLQTMIYHASALVMTHIKRTTTAEWIVEGSPATTVIPFDLQHAVCLEVAEAYHNREGSVSGVLSEASQRCLRAFRDPTLA